MNDLVFAVFAVFVIFIVLYHNGNLEEYFPSTDKDKTIKELKELRELDNKVIEDLQQRLKKNGLDWSIG